MNRLILFTTTLIIFIALILPALLSAFIVNLPQNIQPGFISSKKVYGESIIEHKIFSQKDLFSGIGVSIKNPNLQNHNDLLLEVYDSQNQKVRETSINGIYVADGKFVKLFFNPINSSTNKEYRIKFTSPTSEEVSSLEIEMADQYNTAYVVFNKQSSIFNQIFSTYQSWYTRLTKDLMFAISYSVILIFLTGLLIYSMKN